MIREGLGTAGYLAITIEIFKIEVSGYPFPAIDLGLIKRGSFFARTLRTRRPSARLPSRWDSGIWAGSPSRIANSSGNVLPRRFGRTFGHLRYLTHSGDEGSIFIMEGPRQPISLDPRRPQPKVKDWGWGLNRLTGWRRGRPARKRAKDPRTWATLNQLN